MSETSRLLDDDDIAAAPRRRDLCAAVVMRLPADEERVDDDGLAVLMGWSSGRNAVNRRFRGASLPESRRIGRKHWYSGRAIREWIDSGAAASAERRVACPHCGRQFSSGRGLGSHVARVHRP